MNRKTLFFILIIAFVFFVSCGGQNSAVKPNEPTKVIRTSAKIMPEWVLNKKKSDDFVYFVGISSRVSDLKTAKKASIDDAISQLIEYIGFRATTKFQSRKEISDLDNISGFKLDIVQSIEGKGSANVSVDVQDVYYEEYSDNTISLYSLLKIPVSWVEKERARLQKLVSDQREKSGEYISEANSSIKNGDLARALDMALNALSISEKAAENSDIYDESKRIITLILSSLSFSLGGTPKYAFIEGGSDIIPVMVSSSKTGGGIPGIMLTAYEINGNADIGSKTGNISGEKGIVNFEVEKIKKAVAAKISVAVMFSMNKFDTIKTMDMDFYKEIASIQKSQALNLNLTVARKERVITTAIAVIDIIKENEKAQEIDVPVKFREAVSGNLANIGFNIVSADFPQNIFMVGNEENRIKEAAISFIKKSYPDVKRLFLGIREINILGKIGSDITFKTYDINASDIQIVDMKFVLSLIDVDTKKVSRGINVSSKGQGLNITQAIETAEKRVLDKLEDEFNEL